MSFSSRRFCEILPMSLKSFVKDFAEISLRLGEEKNPPRFRDWEGGGVTRDGFGVEIKDDGQFFGVCHERVSCYSGAFCIHIPKFGMAVSLLWFAVDGTRYVIVSTSTLHL